MFCEHKLGISRAYVLAVRRDRCSCRNKSSCHMTFRNSCRGSCGYVLQQEKPVVLYSTLPFCSAMRNSWLVACHQAEASSVFFRSMSRWLYFLNVRAPGVHFKLRVAVSIAEILRWTWGKERLILPDILYCQWGVSAVLWRNTSQHLLTN